MRRLDLEVTDMPYKRIILALDEDDISHEILNQAIYLAKSLQAKLRIVHVIDQLLLKEIEKDTIVQEKIKIIDYAKENFLQSTLLKIKNEGIEVDTEVIKITNKNQRIALELASAIKEWSADLLVIGAYSRSGFHKLILGHVAESLLRIVIIPILILHPNKG